MLSSIPAYTRTTLFEIMVAQPSYPQTAVDLNSWSLYDRLDNKRQSIYYFIPGNSASGSRRQGRPSMSKGCRLLQTVWKNETLLLPLVVIAYRNLRVSLHSPPIVSQSEDIM